MTHQTWISPSVYMELLQSIYIILLTFRPPLAILLSTTAENVRGPTGITTAASPGKFLHLQGFVSLLVKSTSSSKVSLVSSLPSVLKHQVEYDGEKYSTVEGQDFAYTRNKNLRNITCTPKCYQGDTHFNAASNGSHHSTFTRIHNAAKLAKLVLDKHTLNGPSTLIRSLGKVLNILSSQTRTLSSFPSNDSSGSFQLGSNQLHPKPDILKQQLYIKQPDMSHNLWITSNITQNARHKSKHTSPISNIVSRDKRDITDGIQEPKNNQLQANHDNARIDFVHVFSEAAGYDLTLGSSTPRSTLGSSTLRSTLGSSTSLSTLDSHLQIPSASDPLEKLSRDNSGFTEKYPEMPTRPGEKREFFSLAVKQETAQTEEEDKTASLNKGSDNSSRSLTSSAPVNPKWCQERHAVYTQLLNKLDCMGEQFKGASPDVRYFLPDIEKM